MCPLFSSAKADSYNDAVESIYQSNPDLSTRRPDDARNFEVVFHVGGVKSRLYVRQFSDHHVASE